METIHVVALLVLRDVCKLDTFLIMIISCGDRLCHARSTISWSHASLHEEISPDVSFGIILASPGAFLGASWAFLGRFGIILASPGAFLGASWAVLGPLERFLGTPKSILGGF